jgi:hypothetical protein
VCVSAKFGTVVSVNRTIVEDKMRRFKDDCAHFSFNKCPIYTHDGASAKFSTSSHETDNSAVHYTSLNFVVMFLKVLVEMSVTRYSKCKISHRRGTNRLCWNLPSL